MEHTARMDDDLVTTAEACEMLGVERSTLIRWTHAGRPPKITPAERLTVGGRYGAYRFRRADVEALARELADEREAQVRLA
jgi:excisionase family DNA binding protein